MDYLRSAYTSHMIFRTGDAPVEVRWFKAKPGAGVFPYPHNFGSTNWQERDYQAGDIGEQDVIEPWVTPLVSSRGSPGYPCTTDPTWWLTGIPVGQQAPPVDSDGVPLCCSDQIPCRCGGDVLPSTLTATFPSGGCVFLAGVTVTLNKQSSGCVWYGSGPLAGGGSGFVTLTFRFAGPQADAGILRAQWFNIGTGTVEKVADSSSTCSPRSFVFKDMNDHVVVPCPAQDINIS